MKTKRNETKRNEIIIFISHQLYWDIRWPILDLEIGRFGRLSQSIRAHVESSREERSKPSRLIESIAKQWSNASRQPINRD